MKKQKNQKKSVVFLVVAVLMAVYMGGNAGSRIEGAENPVETNLSDGLVPDDALVDNGHFLLCDPVADKNLYGGYTVHAPQDGYAVVLEPESSFLYADNKSSTEITAEVYDCSTREICKKADGIEIKFSTTFGRMGADTVTIHNGKAVNILYSQDLPDTLQYATSTITAEIITSDIFPELNGYKGCTTVLISRRDMDFIIKTQKITCRSSAIKKGKVVYGSSFFLNAGTNGNRKLTYKSSNPDILSVNVNGKVTVNGYGPVAVKIKAAGGNGYKAAVRMLKLIAVPGRQKVIKADWHKSGVHFQWKTEKTADGYEYAIAYNKKFDGQIRKKTKKSGLILTKYKTGTKQMFLKVRTYKKTGMKTCYGEWSKVRRLRLKKVGKSGESSYAITN